MKTMSLCLALLLVGIPITSGGQQPTEQEMTTRGSITDHSRYAWGNGKAWRILDRQSKISEVEGIENGMMLLLRESYPKLSASDESLLEAEIDKLTISGFRMSDVVEQIDSFYADSSNLRVPMADAYQYAMRKMHGASSSALAAYTAELRARYNQ